jgi:hypothetical protein
VQRIHWHDVGLQGMSLLNTRYCLMTDMKSDMNRRGEPPSSLGSADANKKFI